MKQLTPLNNQPTITKTNQHPINQEPNSNKRSKSTKNQSTKPNNQVFIAVGDPAGIGVEITLKALGRSDLPQDMQPLLVGCKRNVELIYSQLQAQGIKNLANPKELKIIDIPLHEKLKEGEPTKKTGEASFHWLTKAAEIVLKKEARALITAPIA